MISETMQAALNDQLNAEFYSSYLYLSMSAYCESCNLRGFANWLTVQSAEEHAHALKIFRHVLDRGGRVCLRGVEEPPASFQSLEDVFRLVLEHERGVSRKIHELCALAGGENDFAAQVLLQWFVTEQVEEESTAVEMLENIRRVGKQPEGTFLLDREASRRVPSAG